MLGERSQGLRGEGAVRVGDLVEILHAVRGAAQASQLVNVNGQAVVNRAEGVTRAGAVDPEK